LTTPIGFAIVVGQLTNRSTKTKQLKGINMTNIRISDVTKIEVKAINKGSSFVCRDLVIHSTRYDWELEKEVTEETRLDLFLKDASASKLVYSKEMY